MADGDSLTAGLGTIVTQWDGQVVNAIRSALWEGQAAVDVANIHLHKGPWAGVRTLDGEVVEEIAPTLTSGYRATAAPLPENLGKVLKGANPLGTGFQIPPDRAKSMIDGDPSYAEVVKPVFGTEDLTGSPVPEANRWIIDFGGRSLEEASRYPDAMAIIERDVKPYREELTTEGEFRVKRKAYRERWWQLAERSARLHSAIDGAGRVLGMPETSKSMLPAFLPGGGVYLQSLFVFLESDDALFGLLTSSVHWLWAARPGGASGMRTFPRYHQERCFQTFARPHDASSIGAAAGELNAWRGGVMAERNAGMTSIYNLVNDTTEASSDVQKLRDLHVTLDLVVLTAYGWQDLDLDYGVHDHPRFEPRWLPAPPAQRKIEERLLALNAERAGN